MCNVEYTNKMVRSSLTIGAKAAFLMLMLAAMIAPKVSYGQFLAATVYTEKAVLGQQIGGRVGIENPKGLELGAFYQKNITNVSVLSPYGYELLGLYFSPKLLGNDEINLAPYIRAGLSDRELIVVVPGLEVEAQLKGSIYLHFSASLRASEAAFALGLMNKLKRK